MRRDWTGCCRRGALGPGSAAGPISDDAFGDDGTMSKVAVVTGSTKGLGRGLATELLARGHRVAIVSPNGEDSASAARELGEGAAGFGCDVTDLAQVQRPEEHTSELQSLMRISYAVFCLKKKQPPRQHI